MRILVIDDDVTMLWSLSNTLRRWGGEVEVATGARAGIRMLANRPFDVILLDYRMPDHDALWFLRNAVIFKMPFCFAVGVWKSVRRRLSGVAKGPKQFLRGKITELNCAGASRRESERSLRHVRMEWVCV